MSCDSLHRFLFPAGRFRNSRHSSCCCSRRLAPRRPGPRSSQPTPLFPPFPRSREWSHRDLHRLPASPISHFRWVAFPPTAQRQDLLAPAGPGSRPSPVARRCCQPLPRSSPAQVLCAAPKQSSHFASFPLSLLQQFHQVVGAFLGMHQRQFGDRSLLEFRIFFASRDGHQRFCIPLQEICVQYFCFDRVVRFLAVDLLQRLPRLVRMDQPKISNRRPPQFRIFFSLRRLHESSRIASEEECLKDFPPDVRRAFRLVQLLQLARPVNQPQLPDRLAAQRLILLALGRGEQTLVIAADHVAAKNGVFYRSVAARCVNVGQRLPRFSTAEESQIFNRLPLQLRIALSARDFSQNLAGMWRPALCQHEQRLRFFFWRSRTVEHFLEQGHRAFGVTVHQSLDRQHFQFFVALVRRLYRLAGRLLHFDLQRAGIFLPAALRKAPLQIRNGGQSCVPLAQSVLRVSLPVQRRIRLRAIHVRQLLEFRSRTVVAVLIQVLAPVVVQFLQPFDLFLRPFARFLFPLVLFVFSLFRFLLAFVLLLLPLKPCFFLICIPALLRILQNVHRSWVVHRTPMRPCRVWRCQQRRRGDPHSACLPQ